jgi:cytochrome c2
VILLCAGFFVHYLYTVNRQISYITSAHLILIIVVAIYLLISKISSTSNNGSNEAYDYSSAKRTTALSGEAAKGKTLFMSKCASCHAIFKDMMEPALAGFENRGQWADRTQLYRWIRNPETFMKNDPYTAGLKRKFASLMTAFTTISDKEIDLIVAYIKESEKPIAIP